MPDSTERRPRREILLVEDNPGDVCLTREALKSGRLPNNLNVARDGVEAMSYLRREGQFRGSVRPDLILLDLNLPRKGGWEVLAEVKADENLKRIPVLILTTSNSEQDVLGAYQSQASGYISKPADLHQFVAIVRSIEHFWFEVARLPNQ